MAPGLGLYLDEVFFEGYNAKQEAELFFVTQRLEKKEKSGKKVDAKTEGESEERVRYFLNIFVFHFLLSHFPVPFFCIIFILFSSYSCMNNFGCSPLAKCLNGQKKNQRYHPWLLSEKDLSGLTYSVR